MSMIHSNYAGETEHITKLVNLEKLFALKKIKGIARMSSSYAIVFWL